VDRHIVFRVSLLVLVGLDVLPQRFVAHCLGCCHFYGRIVYSAARRINSLLGLLHA